MKRCSRQVRTVLPAGLTMLFVGEHLHPRHSESCHLLPFLQMLTFRTPEPRQFPVGMQKPAFSEVLANISSGTVNRKAGSPCTLS